MGKDAIRLYNREADPDTAGAKRNSESEAGSPIITSLTLRVRDWDVGLIWQKGLR
jgi:hypothetical protein